MTANRGPWLVDKRAKEVPGAAGSIWRRATSNTVQRIWRLFMRIVMRGLEFLPTRQLESLIIQLVAGRAAALPVGEALRFLFRLDAAFYPIQGRKAVEYGGGTHTKHRHTRYHDFFVNRIRAGERVLDIGCGMGAVAYDVAEKAGAGLRIAHREVRWREIWAEAVSGGS